MVSSGINAGLVGSRSLGSMAFGETSYRSSLSVMSDRSVQLILPKSTPRALKIVENSLQMSSASGTSHFGIPPQGTLQADSWWTLQGEAADAPLARYSSQLQGFEMSGNSHKQGLFISPRADGSVIFGVRDSSIGLLAVRSMSATTVKNATAGALALSRLLPPDGSSNTYLQARYKTLSSDMRQLSKSRRQVDQKHCSFVCTGGANGQNWQCWEGSCWDDGSGGWGASGGGTQIGEYVPGGGGSGGGGAPYGNIDPCLVDALSSVFSTYAAFQGATELFAFLGEAFAAGGLIASVEAAAVAAIVSGVLAASCAVLIGLAFGALALYIADHCLT